MAQIESVSSPASIAERIGLDFLEPGLARDVEASLAAGIGAGFVFGAPPRPLDLFRRSVAAAIRRAEADGAHFALLQRLLLHGPRDERMEPALLADCLSDAETTKVIRFIFHSIINRFQGELAELLAVRPLARLLEGFRLPEGTTVHVGDTVRAAAGMAGKAALGADIHLIDHRPARGPPRLVGVAEVKSYALAEARLFQQIDRHIARAGRGLVVGGQALRLGRDGGEVLRIGVVPSGWRLPRGFRFEGEGDGRRLHVDPPVPPTDEDRIEAIGDDGWRITLRWSEEALASAAYDLTLWLMGEVGAGVYRDRPRPEWEGMTAEEMGRNAVKAMLHSAIFSARTDWDRRRVTALYNTYGFGYALGANFVDEDGRRAALWPEDLDELLAGGVTRHGCRLR